jgi:enamine deaminase RidA (YjgF/YER057c/UK114 family)
MTTPYEQLAKLNITLPPMGVPAAAYVPFAQTGDLIFLSGHIAKKYDSGTAIVWTGRLGENLMTADGNAAARAVAIDLLGTLEAACKAAGKDLNAVKRIVKIMGLVNSTDSYTEQHLVINGASELIAEVFGSAAGSHARSAFGVIQLPLGACVEIEMMVELQA